MGECVSTARDIVEYTVTLIPPEDGDSITALSCVAHEYSGLFTRWLQVNDIVDVRDLAQDAEICLCDRMHGTFKREMTGVDYYILTNRLRGYVVSRAAATYMSRSRYTYQFKYGRLIAWRDCWSRVYEVVTIEDEPIIIAVRAMDPRTKDARDILVIAYMQYGAMTLGFTEVARLARGYVNLQHAQASHNLSEDKLAIATRLYAVNWQAILRPYATRGPLVLK